MNINFEELSEIYFSTNKKKKRMEFYQQYQYSQNYIFNNYKIKNLSSFR